MKFAKESMLKTHLSKICERLGCVYTEDGLDSVYTFTMIDGSDSVKLVFDYKAALWYIEVFPIRPDAEITTIHFKHADDAISSFEVWKAYYVTVVKENFKMF